MGVPTFKFKLWAFAMGAAIGGLSGALWAGQASFVNPRRSALENSILVLAAVLLGGAGNIGGAILGGFLVIYVPGVAPLGRRRLRPAGDGVDRRAATTTSAPPRCATSSSASS